MPQDTVSTVAIQPVFFSFWGQRAFGEQLEALSSVFERKIDFRVRCNPVKAARLTDAHLHEVRKAGIFVPAQDRTAYDTLKLEVSRLPDQCCVAFPGRTPEGLHDLVFMTRTKSLPDNVNGLEDFLVQDDAVYRLHYMMFKDRGQIMGFTAYFGIDSQGVISFGSLGKFRFENHPNGQEAQRSVRRALNAVTHMDEMSVLKATLPKTVLSLGMDEKTAQAAHCALDSAHSAGDHLKKDDLKHPMAWLARQIREILETGIENVKRGDDADATAKIGLSVFSWQKKAG